MNLKTGARLSSVVCDTEVIVIRTANADADVRCGGHPMVAKSDEPNRVGSPSPDLTGGTQLGKRYADPDTGLELLVTKAGAGTLSLGPVPLAVKEPTRLPSSD